MFSVRRVLPFATVAALVAVSAALLLPQRVRIRVVRAAEGKQKHMTPSEWQIHLAKEKAQDQQMVAHLAGTLLRPKLPVSPLLHNHRITAWIYLPPGYSKAGNRQRYPVMYLLHGYPGSPRDLFVNASVHRVAEEMILKRQIRPCILVCWEGFGPSGPTDPQFYLDRQDGHYQMESFVVRTLLPWVDSHYRTIPDASHRALVGFSAGGFGAANLGLKHPDKWWVMASISGFFDPEDAPAIMTHVLGPEGPLWAANSPLERVRELPRGQRLHFYMDCGSNDPLIYEFQKMESELKARGIDYEAHTLPGDHAWTYVHQQFYSAFRFCDRRWKELESGQRVP